MSHRLEMLVRSAGDVPVLLAPAVGVVRLSVRVGEIVSAGEVLGELRVLHQRHELVAPAGTLGRIARRAVAGTAQVGFGEALLELAPLELGGGVTSGSASGATVDGTPFVAPMDGMFYRRASPDTPPFVSEGDVIEPGATLGLIEVMKFFYPIRYEGTAPATVAHCAIAEAAAVEAGATLFVLRS